MFLFGNLGDIFSTAFMIKNCYDGVPAKLERLLHIAADKGNFDCLHFSF